MTVLDITVLVVGVIASGGVGYLAVTVAMIIIDHHRERGMIYDPRTHD